jgi:hypothetical protein
VNGQHQNEILGKVIDKIDTPTRLRSGQAFLGGLMLGAT